MKLRNFVGLLALLATLIGFGSAASAQHRGGRGAPPKVIELEAMVIEGKVAKPQVFYVLGRSRIRYQGIKLQRSFVHRIVESAKRNPF
ncbi:MAG: hypothetical protein CSA24_02110 [Deltaproteobacteria bacterium]|nr:MAG: hypothetical protein CSA24_02110 [Deltaproteobacteria bacterium]